MASIKQLPSGKWRARVKIKGGKTLSHTSRTKLIAVTWANSTEDRLARGGVIGDTASLDITFGGLIDRYEREVGHRKKSYKKSEKSRIRKLIEEFKNVPLTEMSPGRVVSYADERLKSVKSDSVKRELSILSSVWETAKILWEMPIKGNPIRVANNMLTQTHTYSPKVKRDRRPTCVELAKLIAELSDTVADIVVFAIETAMRRGEIARIDHTGRAEGSLLISDDKTGKTVRIPLSPVAEDILDRYPGGFNIRPDSITQAFNRARARANILDLRFHDLRHEGASRLFEKGLTIEEVSTITRHSDWRSLKGYTHPSNDLIRSKL